MAELEEALHPFTPPDLLGSVQLPRLPQQARSREKRDRLLEAALATFRQKGYDATAIEDIVAHAGVSVGTFYSYFQSKWQVLVVLIAQYTEDVLVDSLRQLDLRHEPFQSIEGIVKRILRPEAMYVGLWHAWNEATHIDAELRGFDRQIETWARQSVAQVTTEARQAGLIRQEIDSEASAITIIALIWALCEHLCDPTDALIQATSNMIYHSLFA